MNVIHLPTISDVLDADKRADASTAASTVRFWQVALAYALREDATALSFQPWRTARMDQGTLVCTIGDTSFDMVPPDPDPEFTAQLLSAARRLVAKNGLQRCWAWLTGYAAGSVRLVTESESSEWFVVVWQRGRFAGVEFHRDSSSTCRVETVV